MSLSNMFNELITIVQIIFIVASCVGIVYSLYISAKRESYDLQESMILLIVLLLSFSRYFIMTMTIVMIICVVVLFMIMAKYVRDLD